MPSLPPLCIFLVTLHLSSVETTVRVFFHKGIATDVPFTDISKIVLLWVVPPSRFRGKVLTSQQNLLNLYFASKMEAQCSFYMSMSTYHSTRTHTPDGLYSSLHENLASHTFTV
jgi:hypothetical protein